MQGFTAKQAAALSGLSYFRVDSWDRTGFLRPTLAPSSGTGSVRLYSFVDVVALRIGRDLRSAGVSLQALRRVVKYLRGRDGLDSSSALAASYLVTDGRDVYELRGQQTLSLLRSPGQGHLFCVVDLGATVREVRERVKDLPAVGVLKRGRKRRTA